MKSCGPVLFVTLLLVGCAVGSDAETIDPTPATGTPKVDAGGGGTPSLPGEGLPGASGDDDSGTTDPTTEDAGKTTVDAGGVDSSMPTSGGPCTFTGELVAYDLATIVGTSNVPATRTGGSVTTTALSHAGVTAVSSSQAMNASNWSTSSMDTSKYFSFSVTPPSGCSLKLTSLSIDLKASNTGPSNAAVATSLDGFASTKTVTVSTAGGAQTVTLTGTKAGTIEVHVLGYNASSAQGTLRLESVVSLQGQVTP